MSDTPDEPQGDAPPPSEGEIITPADDAKKRRKGATRHEHVRTSGQNDEQRADEEDQSEAFRNAIVLGGLDWRHPGWEPSEKERQMVRVLKFSGFNDEQVAATLDMTVETLQKHFSFELLAAKTLIIGDLTNRALTRARQGDATLTMFLLKTRGMGNFSERTQAVQALADSSAAEGIDDGRRVELVGRILDLLDKRKFKPKKTKDKPEGGDDGGA